VEAKAIVRVITTNPGHIRTTIGTMIGDIRGTEIGGTQRNGAILDDLTPGRILTGAMILTAVVDPDRPPLVAVMIGGIDIGEMIGMKGVTVIVTTTNTTDLIGTMTTEIGDTIGLPTLIKIIGMKMAKERVTTRTAEMRDTTTITTKIVIETPETIAMLGTIGTTEVMTTTIVRDNTEESMTLGGGMRKRGEIMIESPNLPARDTMVRRISIEQVTKATTKMPTRTTTRMVTRTTTITKTATDTRTT
jgi:hypothetical protein